MIRNTLQRHLASGWVAILLFEAVGLWGHGAQAQQPLPPANPAPSVVYKVQGLNDRIEMIVNTSRIITLDQKIPQAQVNNPDILDLVPLSPTQVQVSAKRAGVTQVNIWGEDKRIFTVDVVIFGDARELAMILRTQFPKTALNVVPVGSSVLISGYVDQQDIVPRIIRIAEEYYPKVINNITVSGVQQVVLHVKVMEVSRTKLRNLGFDFAKVSNGGIIMSGIGGLIGTAQDPPFGSPTAAASNTFRFSIVNGSSTFFGVLDALREDKLAKVLAEPNLVTISGRPAYFVEGGELGYSTSNVNGTTIGFKEYGTRVDFVPIVLGNGRIRLEVRPRVSEKDPANSVEGVPALKTREVETGVEMRAGQTLAIAGLVQQRTESSNRGLPWISEVPYLGAPFRTVRSETNEVELLILVTPELVEPMDASQVPALGPGMATVNPNDWQLFAKGHIEVPPCCPHCKGTGCEICAGSGEVKLPCAEDGGSVARQGGNLPGAENAIPTPAPRGAAPPRNPQNPSNPSRATLPPPPNATDSQNSEPSFIGPIGYDVLN